MTAPPIVLDALRRLGPAPLRIEWFGDITYGGRYGGRSPLITIVLARGHQGKWLRTTDFDDSLPLLVVVPVAFLRLLRIGDVWVDGQRFGTDCGSTRLTFQDIRIDDSTTDVLPAGFPVQDADGQTRYLLPFSQFDAHRDHTSSFCARVRTNDGTVLVVPCMELIRFYFGSSGLLLTRLFSGALGSKRLYQSAKRHPVTGVANVTLAPGIPTTAAETIARIAFNRQAAKAAHWIANSGVAAVANGELYYPRTTFPFVGSTDLKVEGRGIGPEPSQVFLVERILQCTHPFPFSRLYVRTTTEIAGEQYGASRRSPTTLGESKRTRSLTSDRSLLEGYVTRALLPIALETDDILEKPFPDLADKPTHRMGDVQAEQPCATDAEHLTGALTAGTQSSRTGGRGVDVTSHPANPRTIDVEPDAVTAFRAVFQELFEAGTISAILLPPLSSEKRTKSSSPFVRGDWIVPLPDGRARQVWCAKINSTTAVRNERFAVLIVIGDEVVSESEVNLLHLTGLESGDDEAVRDAIHAFIQRREISIHTGIVALLRNKEVKDRISLTNLLLPLFHPTKLHAEDPRNVHS